MGKVGREKSIALVGFAWNINSVLCPGFMSKFLGNSIGSALSLRHPSLPLSHKGQKHVHIPPLKPSEIRLASFPEVMALEGNTAIHALHVALLRDISALYAGEVQRVQHQVPHEESLCVLSHLSCWHHEIGAGRLVCASSVWTECLLTLPSSCLGAHFSVGDESRETVTFPIQEWGRGPWYFRRSSVENLQPGLLSLKARPLLDVNACPGLPNQVAPISGVDTRMVGKRLEMSTVCPQWRVGPACPWSLHIPTQCTAWWRSTSQEGPTSPGQWVNKKHVLSFCSFTSQFVG